MLTEIKTQRGETIKVGDTFYMRFGADSPSMTPFCSYIKLLKIYTRRGGHTPDDILLETRIVGMDPEEKLDVEMTVYNHLVLLSDVDIFIAD